MGVQLYVSRSHEIKWFLVSLRLVMIKTMANDSKGVGHTEVEACWIMDLLDLSGVEDLDFRSTKHSIFPRKGKLVLYVRLKPYNYFELLVSLTSNVTRSFASEKIALLFVCFSRKIEACPSGA